ncbi:MAG: dienelactone hydrolase family protein [Solirubrobacterales bacterium]|nr:dienelactone hydrolase family protein [Solirubrobacterales bacterium]
MCFDFDALPPDLPEGLRLAPIAGGAGPELLELESADGTRFSAAFTASPNPTGPSVVILPDVRGLYPFYLELTVRFAEAGHHAIAIDFYGRTAGLGPRDEDFDYQPHRLESRPEHVRADVAAALAALRKRIGDGPVASVGFCFGGMHSFLAGIEEEPELDLAGVVAFYGALDGSRFGHPGPLDRVAEIRRPVLGLFGGDDHAIPLDQVEAFEAGLAANGVRHEIEVYPGAPHSFFDRRAEEYAEASADAWRRTLTFLSGLGS